MKMEEMNKGLEL